eukprot:GHVR01007029.1.p1 GENE.GHVR01007029.1~~GHVR01007029.1.p1  ORF type:complete len:397 (+),score=64.42 GHVR01007029.1:67-1257(+)
MSGKESPFWIVASGTVDGRKDVLGNSLQTRVVDRSSHCTEIFFFDVPENLKFGSFDDLIRLVDDLVKHDVFVEGVLRRVERQLYELSGENTEFRVNWQFHDMTPEQYLKRFCWDDAKFPRTRFIKDNIDMLLAAVAKSDEDVRLKSGFFNELKIQVASHSRKDHLNLTQRNLIDVLTPGTVSEDDFVETEHVTTLIVVIGRGIKSQWESSYEGLCELIVPRSTKQLSAEDREGNALWRVLLFRSAVENFKAACRSRKFVVREFQYSEHAYLRLMEQRSILEAERGRQEVFLVNICKAAFSDTLVGWLHLKAVRVFVEAVLRFGVPPQFGSFFLRINESRFNEKKLRAEIEAALAPPGGFQAAAKQANSEEVVGHDSGEYYPYVSLQISLPGSCKTR